MSLSRALISPAKSPVSRFSLRAKRTRCRTSAGIDMAAKRGRFSLAADDLRPATCPEFEGVADWDQSAAQLPQFRADVWGPYVFVNLHASAPRWNEVFAEIPNEVAQIGCFLDALELSERREYVIASNWKGYVDNYLEAIICRPRTRAYFASSITRTVAWRCSAIILRRSRRLGRRVRGAKTGAVNRKASARFYYWIFPIHAQRLSR
jgi:hypothetical protein